MRGNSRSATSPSAVSPDRQKAKRSNSRRSIDWVMMAVRHRSATRAARKRTSTSPAAIPARRRNCRRTGEPPDRHFPPRPPRGPARIASHKRLNARLYVEFPPGVKTGTHIFPLSAQRLMPSSTRPTLIRAPAPATAASCSNACAFLSRSPRPISTKPRWPAKHRKRRHCACRWPRPRPSPRAIRARW